MENEQEILRTLKEMSARMDSGFEGINEAIAGLERRLQAQEQKTFRMDSRQTEQAFEIEKLKEIIRSLAEADGGIKRSDGTAIQKEPAYAEFEKCGIGKRVAMKELKDAGAIKTDCQGKTTCTVRVDGRPQRLIIVCCTD